MLLRQQNHKISMVFGEGLSKPFLKSFWAIMHSIDIIINYLSFCQLYLFLKAMFSS